MNAFDWIMPAGLLALAAGVLYGLCRTPRRPPLRQRITQARTRIAAHDTTRTRIEEESATWEGPSVAPDIHRRADPRWGTNAALLDQCSLLLPEFAPADRQPHDTHDDQQEGGQP